MKKYQNQVQNILEFMSVIRKQKFSDKELERLFSAMLSPNEIDVFSQRIQVLKLLFEGKSQRDVSQQLGVGVATATRANRMLKENSDLFEKILKSF